MNLARAIATLGITTTLAGALQGCAVETTTSAPESTGAVSSAIVKSPADYILDMSAGLALSIVQGAVLPQLFPDTSFNMKELTAQVDAQVREIMFEERKIYKEETLNGDAERLRSAQRGLAACDGKASCLKKNWQDAHDTLADLSFIISNIGPRAFGPDAARIEEEGLPLYIAAVQFDMNRLALEKKLDAEASTDNDAQLMSRLEDAIAHVRNVTEVLRTKAMLAREAQVSGCYVINPVRPPYAVTWTYYSYFHDDATGQSSHESQADGKTQALARCEGYRAPYQAQLLGEMATQGDANLSFELGIVDGWVAALDALRKAPASQSEKPLGVDFGGMYGEASRGFVNPATGAASCPAGYKATQVHGEDGVDAPLWICTRPSLAGSEPALDFGGMYVPYSFDEGPRTCVNQMTGGASCPAGYTAIKML